VLTTYEATGSVRIVRKMYDARTDPVHGCFDDLEGAELRVLA
jgi:hypothetical protein